MSLSTSPLKYVVPNLTLVDVRSMLAVAITGAIAAGLYGALHDQITFTISPEYFTKVKFAQFAYADFGFGNRVFVATIGFLATWWLGFIIAWFLARRYLAGGPKPSAYRKVGLAFICVFGTCALFGILAFAYGTWIGPDAAVRVAYIHNASYIGGPIGMIIALAAIQPDNEDKTQP